MEIISINKIQNISNDQVIKIMRSIYIEEIVWENESSMEREREREREKEREREREREWLIQSKLMRRVNCKLLINSNLQNIVSSIFYGIIMMDIEWEQLITTNTERRDNSMGDSR